MNISRRKFMLRDGPATATALSGALNFFNGSDVLAFQEDQDLFRIGTAEGPGSLYAPTDVAVDLEGNVHVLDFRDAVVKEYAHTGEFRKTYGGKGEGPGEFNSPSMIRTDGEDVFVYDMRGAKISQFDPDGVYVKSCRTAEIASMINGFQVLDDGNLLLHAFRSSELGSLDETRMFHVVSMDGNLKESFGRVYAYEEGDRLIRKYGLNQVVPIMFPGKITVDPEAETVYFVGEFHPKEFVAYIIGENDSRFVSVDESMTGGFKETEYRRGVFRDRGLRDNDQEYVGIAANQKLGGNVSFVDGVVYCMIRDRVAGETSIKGYSGADGRLILNRNYEADPLQKIPKFCCVDSGSNAYLCMGIEPFPSIGRIKL